MKASVIVFVCFSALWSGLAIGAGPATSKSEPSGSLHACHLSLLQQYYYPSFAQFSPVYHGSKMLRTINDENTDIIVVPTEKGYFVYSDDKKPAFFPVKHTFFNPKPHFTKVVYGGKTIFITEDERGRFDSVDLLPQTSGGVKDYQAVKPVPVAGGEFAAAVTNELTGELGLLHGACSHHREDVEAAGSADEARVKSRERLRKSLAACLSTESDDIAAGAAVQMSKCGFEPIASATGKARVEDAGKSGSKTVSPAADATVESMMAEPPRPVEGAKHF